MEHATVPVFNSDETALLPTSLSQSKPLDVVDE